MKKQQVRKRLTPELRTEQLIKSAVLAATKLGIAKVHHSDVLRTYEEKYGKCSIALAFNYLGGVKELHNTIAKRALDDEHPDPLLVIDACLHCCRGAITVDSEVPHKSLEAYNELRLKLIDLV